ncbi:ribosome-binding protein 1 isoform X1 [Rana temporaria]|nr:ribosome-binding protein 1 isoform X1 [Rana temporaria]
MDLYDPQTLGAMVFGGFMVISAIGIFLVSTFSMKETSYDEALAKQRRELEKGQQPKIEKKRKDKIPEKKGKSKKKDDKPNGKIPEQETSSENEQKKDESEPEVEVEEVKVQETPKIPAVVPAQVKMAPSPKDKKKKQDKKAQKVEPSQSPVVAVTKPVSKQAPVSEASLKVVHVAAVSHVGSQPSSSSHPPKTHSISPKSQSNPPASGSHSGKTQSNAAVTSTHSGKTQSSPPATSAQSAKSQSGPSVNNSQPAKTQSSQPVTNTQSAKAQSSQPNANLQPAKAQSSQPSANLQPAKVQSSQPSTNAQSTKAQSSQPSTNSQSAKTKSSPPNSNPQSAKGQSNTPATNSHSDKVQSSQSASNSQSTKTQSSPPTTKKTEAVVSREEQKPEPAPKKKNVPKKKAEPVSNDLDGALYLPYKTIVSTISSMAFSEGESQKLIEILIEKNGIKQDTWHTASQKGDPVAALKKQLEEKEKLLSAEQEDAAAAKNRLREMNKDLAAEKTKANSAESKLKEQILSRDQEINALQARMQASYKDHVDEIQQLQGKVRGLQEELENGPKAQLARLQQENSILRDALNQATSQTESKQNAELAKLRQECSKLTKELTEKTEVLQQEEQRRKSLDGKVSAYEKQVSQLQNLQQDSETTLQKRLDEVSEELRKSQNSYKNLLADAEKGKDEQKNLSDLQTKLMSYENEGKQKSEEADRLNQKLKEVSGENIQLLERIKSIEALLEAGQSNDTETDNQIKETKESEIAQLHSKLQEKDTQISLLEKESIELKETIEQHENKNNESKESEIAQLHSKLQDKDTQISLLEKESAELKETIEQQKNKNNDLREKNWQAMDALGLAEKKCEEKVNSEKKAKEDLSQQLSGVQSHTKETLMSLFPQVTVESHQLYSEWLQEFREKSSDLLKQLSQPADQTDSSDSLLKLKEAEDAQVSLQAECDQYRTILAETEGMLKDLQKSVEEEEQVWKAKLEASEESLTKSQIQIKTLEEAVERLKLDVQSTDQLKECIALMEAQLETQMNTSSTDCQTYSKEVEILRQLLSESQEHLDATKVEARKQSKELSLLRQQLSEMQNHVHDEKESHGVQDHQLKAPQPSLDEQTDEQTISADLEEKSMYSLQQELEKLKSAEESSTGPEEAQQMKERLDKEKKLTRDLGQAANKLLQLFKAAQEQLAKEKEHNKLLQSQLKVTDQDPTINSGTSV